METEKNLEALRAALYASIRSFVNALEDADAVSNARFNETPEERRMREAEEIKAINRRLFGTD